MPDVPEAPSKPTAFVVSAASGALGVILILLGALTSSNAIFYMGFAMGVLSLLAALTWRAELVSAWRANKR